jgi:hypothetical protein
MYITEITELMGITEITVIMVIAKNKSLLINKIISDSHNKCKYNNFIGEKVSYDYMFMPLYIP